MNQLFYSFIIEGHLGCFQLFSIKNYCERLYADFCVNINFHFFGMKEVRVRVPISESAGLYGNCMFSFIRNHQTFPEFFTISPSKAF